MTLLCLEPLTKTAFARFGDVVEAEGACHFTINQGFAERFNDLATVDVTMDGGSTNISVVEAKPRPRPIAIALMERHPLGSQIFFPLQDRPWLVLVCADPRDASSYCAFVATGRQGINYRRNAWHHPLLALDEGSRFLIVDRIGPGRNLDEVWLEEKDWLYLKP